MISAALDNLVRWIDKGVAAPRAPRIETLDEGRTVVRDAHGKAKGGVRTPYLDVPVATYNVTSTTAPTDPQTARCDGRLVKASAA